MKCCEHCGVEMIKPYFRSRSSWATARFCGAVCRDARRAAERTSMEELKRRARVRARERHRANPTLAKQRWAKYSARCRDFLNAKRRQRYAASIDVERARARECVRRSRLRTTRWEMRNPVKRRAARARRRARERGAKIGRIDFAGILRDSGGLCGICHKPLDLLGYEFDHMIPLAAGGPHTQENLQVAHVFCNRSKGARVA